MTGAHSSATAPVAAGVHCLRTGPWRLASNDRDRRRARPCERAPVAPAWVPCRPGCTARCAPARLLPRGGPRRSRPYGAADRLPEAAAARPDPRLCTGYEGRSYLVALAGDSNWVRNVRAAGGSVVISRRERHPAMLVEVPPQDRPPIIRAYSHRPGRSTTAAAREARTYFGLGTHPSEAQLQTAADRYPVFLIEEPPAVAGDRSGPNPATSQASTPAAAAGRLGTVLLVASAAGAPLSLLALRHLGRWGRVLVASGCAVLFVRDTTMVASGTPGRLRSLPRALLVAESPRLRPRSPPVSGRGCRIHPRRRVADTIPAGYHHCAATPRGGPRPPSSARRHARRWPSTPPGSPSTSVPAWGCVPRPVLAYRPQPGPAGAGRVRAIVRRAAHDPRLPGSGGVCARPPRGHGGAGLQRAGEDKP